MNDKSNQKKNKSEDSTEFVCGECGGKKIETVQEIYKFPYGVGTDAVELSCKVPVRHCVNCGFNFIDGEAEDLCHEEICKYLGVMAPEEIRNIRESKGLSQAEFCRITKLGEATMSRWERGVLIQNAAYDNYMFLLKLPLNFERILQRSLGVEKSDETKEENKFSLTKTFPKGSPSFCKLATM